MIYSLSISNGDDVEIFASFDTVEEAFSCYKDLREHNHFGADSIASIESRELPSA